MRWRIGKDWGGGQARDVAIIGLAKTHTKISKASPWSWQHNQAQERVVPGSGKEGLEQTP